LGFGAGLFLFSFGDYRIDNQEAPSFGGGLGEVIAGIDRLHGFHSIGIPNVFKAAVTFF